MSEDGAILIFCKQLGITRELFYAVGFRVEKCDCGGPNCIGWLLKNK